ncbi:MAG TPA: hypothetical protein VK034_05840, partial [Enhygromyxa sp.]|nr:hypothetical protein [Enhygromyxa sp.]
MTDLKHLQKFSLALALVGVLGCDQDEDPDLDKHCRELQVGHACTWVGTPRSSTGYNGDGLHRLETSVAEPQDLLFLPDGSAWFTD